MGPKSEQNKSRDQLLQKHAQLIETEKTVETKQYREQLLQKIAEMREAERTAEMKWIARYRNRDEEDGNWIRLGIKKVSHLFYIYFDFDMESANMAASTEEDAIAKIEKHWSFMTTYERID